MKRIVIAMMAAAGLCAAGLAQAQDGAALAEKNGCMKCHKMDAKGKGPALKEAGAALKGKPVDQVVAALKDSKGHKKLEASDADLKTIAAWLQTL
jgi:cytochrome c